jgi:hypothetical protein
MVAWFFTVTVTVSPSTTRMGRLGIVPPNDQPA